MERYWSLVEDHCDILEFAWKTEGAAIESIRNLKKKYRDDTYYEYLDVLYGGTVEKRYVVFIKN